VVLLLDGDQVAMLDRGVFGAFFHRPAGQARSRNRKLKKLGRALSGLKVLRAATKSPGADVERGSVVRLASRMDELLEGRLGDLPFCVGDQGGRDGLDWMAFGLVWRSLPVYRISVVDQAVVAMASEQLKLLASAIEQTIEEIENFEIHSILGWTRWELRELEARLVEVMACLDDQDDTGEE
jgi:hypothetical protein